MNALQYMYNKLKRLDFKKAAVQALKELEPELADANTEQLMEGKNAADEIVGVYRNPVYASFKYNKNPKPGKFIVDLNLTGDFHSSIKAKVSDTHITYTASDSKAADLLDKYGNEVLGLSVAKWKGLRDDMVVYVLRDNLLKQLSK